MSTGATLASLIEDLQLEIGQSTAVGVGQNFRGHLAHRLKREYKRLYDDFAWPHLLGWADLSLVAGTKTYTLPNLNSRALRLSDIQKVYVKWGGQYRELCRGIDIDDYNAFDSDVGARSDPALKWRPTSETQIEVWPIPASAAALRILAKKPFLQMALETDVCDLDDDLVVLNAAAEYLQRQGSKEAAAVFARAQTHYATLKQRSQVGVSRVNLVGPGGDTYYDPRRKVFVGVVPGSP